MASKDSFGARSTLEVGGSSYEIYRLDAVTGEGLDVESLPVQPQGAAGEPAPHRGRRGHHRRRHQGHRRLGRGRGPGQGDPVHPGAGDHAGLHRCAVRGRPGHHARGDGRPGRRPDPDQPVGPGGDGHRPLRHRRRVRHARGVRAQRRDRVRAQPRALPVPALGQGAFDDFKVVPPGTGIVHQVNIEHLARVVFTREADGATVAYPDTCVGTDSHTTMVNGIGVVGWGVGGIEAEAAMLGQPVSMLIPRVVGFKLSGDLPEGATATDLVLTITEMLRQHGVVGKFVEFYGPGVSVLPLANRATIGNMSPEFGSTIAVFPIDGRPEVPRATGRSPEQLALVEALREGAGSLARPGRRAAVLREARARPRHRRPVARRAQAAARTASRCPTPRSRSARAGRLRRRVGRGERVRRGGRRVLPGLRLAEQRPR